MTMRERDRLKVIQVMWTKTLKFGHTDANAPKARQHPPTYPYTEINVAICSALIALR
jgi:hypothetical protein